MMKTMKKTIAIALAFCLAFAGVLSSTSVTVNAAGELRFDISAPVDNGDSVTYTLDHVIYSVSGEAVQNFTASYAEVNKFDEIVEATSKKIDASGDAYSFTIPKAVKQKIYKVTVTADNGEFVGNRYISVEPLSGYVAYIEDNEIYAGGCDSYVAGVAKVNKDKVATVKNWTYFEDSVDLSAIGVKPATKSAYIAVRGLDNGKYTEPVFFKMVKQATTKFVAVAVPSSDAEEGWEGYEVQIHKNNKTGELVSAQNVSCDDEGGLFVDVPDTAYTTEYYVNGKETGALTAAEKVTFKGVEYDVADAGEICSKAIKCKIKPRGAAPSATINYTTGKYTIPKGCEYRFVTPDTLNSDWTKTDSKLANKDIPAADGVLQVRKSATTNAVASKIKSLEFSTLTLDQSKVTVTYDSSKKKVKVINETGFTIDYTIDESKKTAPNKKLKNTKSVTLAKANGKKLYVRIAGDKTNCTLPGKVAIFDYDVASADASKDALVDANVEVKASGDAIIVTASSNASGKVNVVSADASADASGEAVLKTGTLTSGACTITGVPAGDYKVIIEWDAASAKKFKAVDPKKVTVA